MSEICAGELRPILQTLATPPKFAPNIEHGAAWVRIRELDLRAAAELCYRTTTANDLLLHLGSFPVKYESEIKRGLRQLAWSKIAQPGVTFALRTVCTRSRLYHSGLVRNVAAASLEELGYHSGRPGDTTLELRLEEDVLHCYVSAAGEALNQRSYRRILKHEAPIKETVAACCIRAVAVRLQLAEAELHSAYYVPFAGSGTFGFEALLLGGRLAPGLFRPQYAIERFPGSSQRSLAHARRKLSMLAISPPRLAFVDNESGVVEDLVENIGYFNNCLTGHGLAPCKATVQCRDYFDTQAPFGNEAPLGILLNPPYGHRLNVERHFFKELGRKAGSFRAGSVLRWGLALLPTPTAEEQFLKAARPALHFMFPIKHGGRSVRCLGFRL